VQERATFFSLISNGVRERADFQVATATTYSDEFNLIRFFDCLQDMGGASRLS
jgi:hypothetical protein